MEADEPPAEARSKAHQLIKTIAQDHTLNGTIFGTKFELLVNNCLEILSNQLYEKSTHFLLELIQNADDNIYRCTTPTLSFTYKPGSLRIDCNEVGFDASNVEAICGISQSTKSGKTSDGEFIGEKGIGFKSVFKAADVVWIASNEFTFKFDRTKPLGVITPIWEGFPETTRLDCTSIFLKLSTTYDEETLVKELLEFDTNLCIFLRRVEELNIRVTSADESIWKKQIRKTQHQQESDRIVSLQSGTETLKYLVRTHVIKDLPQEIKRPNWPQTKILLAFPVPESSEQPLLKPQNVYAFLPIRNYGFKFLIQADFLLTASREEIESTLPWNRRIRDALAEAFILSMFHFNEGILKYVWPYYLPSMSIAVSGFFEPAIESILRQLGESPVFESCAGTMVKPSTLVHVPADFCAAGLPFTLCSLTKDRWVIEAMTSVGVSQLSPRQFLEDLSAVIATDAPAFHNKSAEWHSQLATALVKLSTDTELMPLLQDLAIIPLNDGTWTAIRDRTIFFAKGDASLEIPSGIRVLIVDVAAESDPSRRTLFTSLGVKAWEAPEICRLILKVHCSADFKPEQLSATQIVSHAVFLYQAAWQPPKSADLWFATAKDERCRGREMYISGSANLDSASGRVFAQLEKRFPVMHVEYLTALASEAGWPDWLVQNLGLSRIPRLITPVVEPRPQPTGAPVVQTTEEKMDVKAEDAKNVGDDLYSDNSSQENLFDDVGTAPMHASLTDVDIRYFGPPDEEKKDVDPLENYIWPGFKPTSEQETKEDKVLETDVHDGLSSRPLSTAPSDKKDWTDLTATTSDNLHDVPKTEKKVQTDAASADGQAVAGTEGKESRFAHLTASLRESYKSVHPVDGPKHSSEDTLARRPTANGNLNDPGTTVETEIKKSTSPSNPVFKEQSIEDDIWDWGPKKTKKERRPRAPTITMDTKAADTKADVDLDDDWGFSSKNMKKKKKKKTREPIPEAPNPPLEVLENHDSKDDDGWGFNWNIKSKKKTKDEAKVDQVDDPWASWGTIKTKKKDKNPESADPGNSAPPLPKDDPKNFDIDIDGIKNAEGDDDWSFTFPKKKKTGNKAPLKAFYEDSPESDTPGNLSVASVSDDENNAASRRRARRLERAARAKPKAEIIVGESIGTKDAAYVPGPLGDLKRARRTLSEERGKSKASIIDADLAQSTKHIPEDVPRTPTPPQDLLFTLSEEFTFMLQECVSSDVLQLLRENWHHYSQWIEGAHMKWQTEDYVAASTQLKNRIGASPVRTVRGSLPLNETVLESLDNQLDQGKMTPVLEVQDPSHAEWNLLSYFGVLMKADVNYYLRCLITVSKDVNPDVDIVAYIYEQIQHKYTSNEELIRAAFYNRDIVFVPAGFQATVNEGRWTRMEDCISKEIDIGSKYLSCAYLFQCLVSPTGDPIGGLVHTMTLINSSSKLDDIARLFREVSKLLKDVSTSKAALLLKPLQSKTIFPVVRSSQSPEYDTLLGMHDKSWFVADQVNLLESFTGVVPLLAFSIQDLPAVEDLFRVLRVEGRKMSKMVTSQTLAQGQTRSDFRHSDTFRSKSPFIKALIPRNHPSEAAIKRQITGLRVRIATAVSQTFTMILPDKEVYGNPIPGHVSISSVDNVLTLVMTEESATAECPSHELVSLLAEACGITDQKHISLLFTALSNLSLKSINAAFVQQGIKVEGLLLPEEPKNQNHLYTHHQTQRIDGTRMPSPFYEKMLNSTMGPNSGYLPEGLMFGRHGYAGTKPPKQEQNQHPDRRLPMLQRIQGVGTTYTNIPLSDLVPMQMDLIGWENMQYLGENMIARLLQIHLGQIFDPERDWTSKFRERAGHSYFSAQYPKAPFILGDIETRARMTEFLIKYGVSTSSEWQKKLNEWRPKYHVDVVCSAGGEGGLFVMHAKWLERLFDFKIPTEANEPIKDVSVLIRVGRAYSQSDFALEVYVDPWYLLKDGKLTFRRDWLLSACISDWETASAPLNDDTASTSSRTWSLAGDDDSPLSEKSEPSPSKNSNESLHGHRTAYHKEDGTPSQEIGIMSQDKNDTRPQKKDNVASADKRLQIVLAKDTKSQGSIQHTLYLPWAQSTTTGILRTNASVLHTTGTRDIYTYKPLLPGFMRLLYLLPGMNDEPLQAVLNHIHCSDTGKYQALSYVWGTDQCTEELVTPDGIIPITSSLCSALQSLRQNHRAIMIWADAVCINHKIRPNPDFEQQQQDSKEKAQQIRLMPQIFQACEQTYAFLSASTPHIDAALEMLMQVRSKAVIEERQRSKDGDDLYEWPAGLPRIPSSWHGNRIPSLRSPIWTSVKALFALPYFRRAWIIQEVVASPNVKVVCGKWLIDWQDLFAGLETIDREIQISDNVDLDIGELRAAWEPFMSLAAQREWEARQYRWSLLMLLEHFRYASSTLCRDRLFALVGLASDGNEAEFQPDYDLPFADIVLKFAKAFVRQGRGIQLLYRAGLTGPKTLNKFPSWVPDWMTPRPVGLHDSSDTDITFSACGPQPPDVSLGPETDELSVAGYDLDAIAAISSSSNTEAEWAAYFEEIDNMVDEGVLSGTMGAREDLKWKVPIAAAPFPRSADAGTMDMRKSYHAFRKWLSGADGCGHSSGRTRTAQKSYIACLKGTLEGWKFVVTKRGYVGVVPGLGEVGDVVAIMKGGCVPFLVRESEERQGRVRLIGECYVHGVMKGEGIWLPGVEKTTFELH
ncbi:hypothetical protein N0V90_010078 [Kalmusia sp. IMI 367209]|nr:hypothetical protein N0V90_010078 [Kalmusia sp. IMI 367209]